MIEKSRIELNRLKLKRFNHHLQVSFKELNITEEEGELARAVRAIEIGRSHPGEAAATTAEKEYNLREEMADIIDQVLILADKYGVSGEELLQFSEDKLKKRWHLE